MKSYDKGEVDSNKEKAGLTKDNVNWKVIMGYYIADLVKD